jgi:hypothetical protein
LYSCYGTTANCNTYPVAFGILFGNEDNEGWMDFWDFAKSVHPSIDDTRVTIITHQANGLTQSIAGVLPSKDIFIALTTGGRTFSNLLGEALRNTLACGYITS